MRYEVVSPLALYDAMSQHQNTLNKQNAALGMMQTNGWGGGAGILGAALGGLLANKYGQEANQQQAEIAKQQFLYEQQQHRLAQEAQAQAEQAKLSQQYEALVPFIGEEKAQAVVFGGQKLKDLKPEQTTAMQNAAAMGLNPGSPEYNAYIEKVTGKAGTTINMPEQFGTIPTGYMLKTGEDGSKQMVPVPGSPAEREANAAKNQAVNSTQTTLQSGQNIQEIGQQVVDQVSPWNSGFFGSMLKGIGGTSAKDLQANLGTLQADSAFSTLVELKKNGGTLGAISQSELDLLKSAQAALDQDQSPAQLRENIKRYLDIRQNLMTRAAEAYKTDFGVYPEGFGMGETEGQASSVGGNATLFKYTQGQ